MRGVGEGRGWEGGRGDVHNKLHHNHHPREGKIPMKPIEIHPPSANNATGTIVFPQPPKPDKILNDAGSPQRGGNDRENGIRSQRGVVPEAEVEDDGHCYAVEEDERPEDEDAEFARAEGVV